MKSSGQGGQHEKGVHAIDTSPCVERSLIFFCLRASLPPEFRSGTRDFPYPAIHTRLYPEGILPAMRV